MITIPFASRRDLLTSRAGIVYVIGLPYWMHYSHAAIWPGDQCDRLLIQAVYGEWPWLVPRARCPVTVRLATTIPVRSTEVWWYRVEQWELAGVGAEPDQGIISRQLTCLGRRVLCPLRECSA